MSLFLKKYWQDILWLGGYMGVCIALMWMAGFLGIVIALGIGIAFYVSSGLSRRGTYVAAWTVLGGVIGLASMKAYDYAKETKWKFMETSDAALVPKPKSETEKLAVAVRTLEKKIDTALDNGAALRDTFDSFKKETEDRLSYDRGRLDALSQAINERPAAPVPQVTEPAFEWVPVLPKGQVPAVPSEPAEGAEQPKGSPLPNTEPKEPLPQLRAKIPEAKKCLCARCSNGILHQVKGFWEYPDGTRIPDYRACRNGCTVERYEMVVQK